MGRTLNRADETAAPVDAEAELDEIARHPALLRLRLLVSSDRAAATEHPGGHDRGRIIDDLRIPEPGPSRRFRSTLKEPIHRLFCGSLTRSGFLGLDKRESLVFRADRNHYEQIRDSVNSSGRPHGDPASPRIVRIRS